MKRFGVVLMVASLAFSGCARGEEPTATAPPTEGEPTAEPVEATPRVAIETDKGRIVVELDALKAPKTVASFLDNVQSGFYEGTVFHRVIAGFMVQGGGYTTDGNLKPTDKTLVNEADNGLGNVRGTIAMARKNDPHSASVQFYINHVDNAFLDHTEKTAKGWGYAVFGRVIEGMDVVDAIAADPPKRGTPPVVITGATILSDSE